PDGQFDAVVCVFGIFFVPDMPKQVAELWRMVRPGGHLAITTWGPGIFAPLYTVWNEAVREERADLYTAFNAWDRITTPEAVRQLFADAGVSSVEVVPEAGTQLLRAPEDWWDVVMGSGLRWAVEQLGPEAAARVRTANVAWAREHTITAIETNA